MDSNYTGQVVVVPSTNPVYNTTFGYTAILANKSAGTIVGAGLSSINAATIPSYIGDVSSATAQVALGMTFTFVPNASLTQTLTTSLTVVGNESGGSITIPVTVNVIGS